MPYVTRGILGLVTRAYYVDPRSLGGEGVTKRQQTLAFIATRSSWTFAQALKMDDDTTAR